MKNKRLKTYDIRLKTPLIESPGRARDLPLLSRSSALNADRASARREIRPPREGYATTRHSSNPKEWFIIHRSRTLREVFSITRVRVSSIMASTLVLDISLWSEFLGSSRSRASLIRASVIITSWQQETIHTTTEAPDHSGLLRTPEGLSMEKMEKLFDPGITLLPRRLIPLELPRESIPIRDPRPCINKHEHLIAASTIATAA